MENDTPQGGGAGDLRETAELLDENLKALLAMMSDLKIDIHREWQKVKRGEAEDKALVRKMKMDVPALLRLAIEQETKLNDETSSRAGRAGAFALDLGQVRIDIGSRLARLRAAGSSAGISGEPE